MKELNDDGPAFPTSQYGLAKYGMSLRAYFASHAPKIDRLFEEPNDKYLARQVAFSFKYADAMIAELRGDVPKSL